MKVLRIFSRLFLGVLFIFSGFVKAIDPLGSSYKFTDYFHAFSLDFLDSLSLGLGIFLAAFEFVLGLVLILGYQKKIVYWVLLVFMSFFTLLTFILALANPVTDCGCFGDAIILTNWETFFKNVLFMLFVIILFAGRKSNVNVLSDLMERALIVSFFGAIILVSVSSIRHLPIIDFRPYDIGTHIPAEMEVPEDAPQDEYSTILVYRNKESGEEEEFTIENYPTDTLLYEFVTSDSKLISQGYEPPIHDFGILDRNGDDITDLILEDPGYTLLMISYNVSRAEGTALASGNQWRKLEMLSDDFSFLPVTASVGQQVEDVKNEFALSYNFFAADEIMLKTVVRSNPGFVLLHQGTIIGKWSWRDMPQMDEWNPKWPELLDQFQNEVDPEIQQLIDEGIMDPITYNVIDFGRSADAIVSTELQARIDKGSWIILILSVLSLLLFLQSFKVKEKDRRVF